MNLTPEEEIQGIQEELSDLRKEYDSRERDSHARITDEDRFLVSMLRLENRIRELEDEEQRLQRLIEETA